MKTYQTRSVEQLIQAINAGERAKYVFFWGHTPKDHQVGNECLSQWYTAPFKIGSHTFATAEHYMMFAKAELFGDVEIMERVLTAPNPGAAKALGRSVKGFDESIWQAQRFAIVVKANVEKFGQNTNIQDYLKNTQKRVLVEASPKDSIWGVGMAVDDALIEQPSKWRGLNLLGFALMEVRDRL